MGDSSPTRSSVGVSTSLNTNLSGTYVNSFQSLHTTPAQQCSACGSVDAGNRVSQSLFRCLSCGHETNADVNAAENIRRLGVETQARAGNISLGVPPETLVLQRRVMW